jgi:hypothetical protein
MAIELAVAEGVDREQCVSGSIPEASLEFATSFFSEHLSPPPWVGLHVGNFVGISLAYLVNAVRDAHPESVILSIDPDIPHRGVNHPSRVVISLLNSFGLQDASLLLTGYSLEKNVSNDGSDYDTDYDPLEHYEAEISLHNQLPLLKTVARGAFHFAVVDSNHDASYLNREIDAIRSLLVPGGLVILDDVSSWWSEIRSEYWRLSRQGFVDLGTDGRVGVLSLATRR